MPDLQVTVPSDLLTHVLSIITLHHPEGWYLRLRHRPPVPSIACPGPVAPCAQRIPRCVSCTSWAALCPFCIHLRNSELTAVHLPTCLGILTGTVLW